MEQRAWPLTHYLTPAALYWATRDPVLTLLLVYVWETVEASVFALAKGRYVMFAGTGQAEGEQALDSLVGDPAMGALAIGTLTLADYVWGWPVAGGHEAYETLWSAWLRAGAFATQALPSLAIDWRHSGTDRGLRTGALLYGSVYVVAGALWYGIPIAVNDEQGVRGQHAPATAALVAWLVLAAVQTAQVVLWSESSGRGERDLLTGRRIPPGPLSAVWTRTFTMGLIAGLAVVIGLIGRVTASH